jgi:hypothetical protein
MELTREYLIQKREEYRNAYMNALSTANANHGAMQAVEELLKRLDEPEPVEMSET